MHPTIANGLIGPSCIGSLGMRGMVATLPTGVCRVKNGRFLRAAHNGMPALRAKNLALGLGERLPTQLERTVIASKNI